jgi:arylmalonate decarboxylase
MTHSRRDFLMAGCALAAAGGLGKAAANPVLGMIFPTSGPMIPEALAMYPSGVSFLRDGVGLQTMTPEGYDSVIDRIVPAAQGLARQGARAVILFGTSLSFYKGAAFNQHLADSIHNATGLPSTTMSTAVVEGLRAVGARRLAVATAYNEDVSGRLRTFLTESGFEVLTVQGLGLVNIADPDKVSQRELEKFCAGVAKNAPQADAMVVSCGGLRTLELIAPLEKECGMPVISSTPHALWAGVRLLGLQGKAPGYGTLLSRG